MTAWLRQTRARLALAYSGLFTLVTVVAAGAVLLAIATVEYSGVDDSLASASKSLEPSIVAGTDQPLSALGGAPAGAAGTPGIGIAAYLFDSSGNVVDRTPDGPAAGDVAPLARRALSADAPVFQTQAFQAVPERVRATSLRTRAGDVRVLVVARSLAEANQLVGTTATVLLLGMAGLIVAATVLGYGLAGTALRPVREITAAARALSEEDLHRRITLDLPPDELGDLAATFNAMLDRLESAFASLRRFTADAAHELRAPLTLIRTEAEVTLSRERTAEEYRASLATILSEAERLSRMADQLLMLARAEAGALAQQMTDVPLAELAAETVRLWQPLATDRQVSLVAPPGPPGAVRGDPDLLRRLLDNLIDNAIRHSSPGATVMVTCAIDGRSWVLAVADTGTGVPEAARASIFERFSRADEARARDSGGAGLGLALCAAIARIHNGSIGLEDNPGGGARFVVRLPVPPSARS